LRLSISDVSMLLLLYGVRMKAVGPFLKNNGDSLDIVLRSSPRITTDV